MPEYVEAGYREQGYIECQAPGYIESGYVFDGYFEGCADAGALVVFGVDYAFQKAQELKNGSVTYLYSPQKTIYTVPVPYLYDNQLSLDPIRIVREKIS